MNSFYLFVQQPFIRVAVYCLTTMKTNLFILAFFALPTLICAQSAALVPNMNQIYTDELVQISSQKVDCVDASKGTAKQYVVLTVWNKQEIPINVSFKKETWFDNKCSNCNSESPEYRVNLNLDANSAVRGSCATDNRELRIFSKMLELKNVRELTHYELKNIEVETVD